MNPDYNDFITSTFNTTYDYDYQSNDREAVMRSYMASRQDALRRKSVRQETVIEDDGAVDDNYLSRIGVR